MSKKGKREGIMNRRKRKIIRKGYLERKEALDEKAKSGGKKALMKGIIGRTEK